jgi:hypothetical protein
MITAETLAMLDPQPPAIDTASVLAAIEHIPSGPKCRVCGIVDMRISVGGRQLDTHPWKHKEVG